MPNSYDPTSAAVTVDALIPVDGDDVNYIVTAFSRNGPAPVGPDLSNSDGSYRGMRRVLGAEDASMTVEIEHSTQPRVPYFAEFGYDGSTWVVLQPAKAISSTSAGTQTLSLRCKEIPGTIASISVDGGGTGYGDSGALAFSTGNATGTWTATAGVITSVTITYPGRGYESAPTVTAVGGGTGATFTATIYTTA
jgi:hypothetical protein